VTRATPPPRSSPPRRSQGSLNRVPCCPGRAPPSRAGPPRAWLSFVCAVLTMEETTLLLRYWEHKIQLVCRSECAKDPSRFTLRVMSAAQMFFKRFYLNVSIMEVEPKAMMLACLILAGKVEEEKIEAEPLIASYHKKIQPKELASIEMQLLQVLRFQLCIHSPFRCLNGLMQDLAATLNEEALQSGADQQDEQLQQLHDCAVGLLCEAQSSDAPFLYSPQQLAVEALDAAIRSVEKSTGKGAPATDQMREWMDTAIAEHDRLRSQVDAVRQLREGSSVDLSDEAVHRQLKQIDSRLRAVTAAIKGVLEKRAQLAVAEAELATSKREAEKAKRRAGSEAEHPLWLQLKAEGLLPGDAADGEFSIKRPRPSAPEGPTGEGDKTGKAAKLEAGATKLEKGESSMRQRLDSAAVKLEVSR